MRHCGKCLGTARPVFGEHEAKLIAHELQIIENLFDRGRSACFVVNEANALAAVCEYAGFHTVDAPGQSHGQMLVHAFRPPSDQCSHQTDQRVPTDWVQAGHGIVCVEYVTHIESCGKLPFAFGTGQCANAEVAGVLAKIRFRIGVAAHKVIGDVAQGIRRGLVLTGGLIAVPGVGYGIRIRTFALIDGIKPCRDSLDATFRAGRGVQAQCGQRLGIVGKMVQPFLAALLRNRMDEGSETGGHGAGARTGEPVLQHPAHRARP